MAIRFSLVSAGSFVALTFSSVQRFTVHSLCLDTILDTILVGYLRINEDA